jgi:alpha-methylacyl-CoA racemase
MGPLTGVRILELAAPGPVAFAGTLLADLGADVVLVERPGTGPGRPTEVLRRGRRSIVIDLRADGGAALLLRIADRADGLLEGMRPGVAERLGIGPDACRKRNPGLVYGRVTGWGREGPLAATAGFDINFAALSGALHMVGRAGEPPVPTPGFLSDFAGGGMLLALGVVSALVERARSGLGDVVDAAMVDGAALLTAHAVGDLAHGSWSARRGTNLTDSGAPFCDTYETADGGHVAVGALHPRFFATLVELAGLPADTVDLYGDRERWPELRERLTALFSRRSRAEWVALFEDTDACVTPVLAPGEVSVHRHTRAREGWVAIADIVQPAPAPRFARQQAATPSAPPRTGGDTRAVLTEFGFTDDEIDAHILSGALHDGHPSDT